MPGSTGRTWYLVHDIIHLPRSNGGLWTGANDNSILNLLKKCF